MGGGHLSGKEAEGGGIFEQSFVRRRRGKGKTVDAAIFLLSFKGKDRRKRQNSISAGIAFGRNIASSPSVLPCAEIAPHATGYK